ncbi:DUF2971 domain-containing protein [Pseudohongiella acticola]|uniref:DUF2971 domain-containing protein n=1 Tax=Pseudohongiella acticola TaxID=1524254 RepID=UPI00147143F4|nr:DUF2971 domain-containing protein [Pseudohongiella acticola]
MKSIKERRLKVARILELNDPFEFLGANLKDREFRRAMNNIKEKLSETKGLLCFSKTWNNPVLWSHYADHHRGVCLEFEIPEKNLSKVDYVEERIQYSGDIDTSLMRRFLTTKFEHWSYEQEYRAFIGLDLESAEDGLYFMDFDDNLVLKSVIIGHSSLVTRLDVSTALGSIKGEVETFKARAAFTRFEVIRNENENRWT